MAKYIDLDGLRYFWQKIKSALDAKLNTSDLSSSVSSTSTSKAATSAAVKTAYDKAVTAESLANSAYSKAAAADIGFSLTPSGSNQIGKWGWALGRYGNGIGKANGDQYYMAVAADQTFYVGVQINGSTTATWRAVSEDSGWISCWGDFMKVRKRNGIVTCIGCGANGTGGLVLTPNVTRTISTAPVGYRPDVPIHFTGSSLDGKCLIHGRIGTDGILTLITPGSVNGYWSYCFSYPV